jgi:hypothetical protein
MKFLIPLVVPALAAAAYAAEVPKAFAGLLQVGVATRGQIGMVVPPAEIDKYVAKVEASARKDPKWFREFSAEAKPGVPLPFDERLGLTKEEYAEYLALWNKREFKAMEDVVLMLRQGSAGSWVIASTGGAGSLSTLRYLEKDDVFRSPNGELKRLDDIKADPASILGEWTGSEWKFEEETGLGKTKENLALGRMADGKFGLVVYRVQELSSEGTRLLDKSIVIRFRLGKPADKAAPADKPAPVKVTPKKPQP